MTWFRRRPSTPLPGDPRGFSIHEAAAIAEGHALPGLPSVAVDLLCRTPAGESVAAALESAPWLCEDVAAALDLTGPRALGPVPGSDLLDAVAEVCVARYLDRLPPPLGAGSRKGRDLHLFATAAAARALTLDAGLDRDAARAAWLAGSLYRLGVAGLEAYVRRHWPEWAHGIASGGSDVETCCASLGCSPWRIGAALLNCRGLPPAVTAAVGQLAVAPHPPASARLWFARRAARLAGAPADEQHHSGLPAPVEAVQAASAGARRLRVLRRKIGPS